METESEPLNPNLIQIESKLEIDQPLGEIIKKKKDKKKAKKEKLIEQLEKKRKIDDYSQEFSSGNSEAAKKIKFDNIFDAQKAQGLKGRDFTVSLALAGSILDNAQSAELRTYLAGQIARALAVFNIDEVIIFSDDKETEFAQGNSQLVNILKYLECPQYLRKDLFPIHRYVLLFQTSVFGSSKIRQIPLEACFVVCTYTYRTIKNFMRNVLKLLNM